MSVFHPKLSHGTGLIIVREAYNTFFAKSGVCDQRMIGPEDV